MAKRRKWIIQVQGPGAFPIDMLRYDRLTPHHEIDSARIERTMTRGHLEPGETVELLHSGEAPWEPERARWGSFAWTVVSVEVLA